MCDPGLIDADLLRQIDLPQARFLPLLEDQMCAFTSDFDRGRMAIRWTASTRWCGI
jgi:hypothetical protein